MRSMKSEEYDKGKQNRGVEEVSQIECSENFYTCHLIAKYMLGVGRLLVCGSMRGCCCHVGTVVADMDC